MRRKLTIAIAITTLTITVVTAFLGSRAVASGESDKAEIVALNQRLADAFNKRDIDGVMSCYVNDADAIFYGDTTPFQMTGTGALRKGNQEFVSSATKIHSEMKDIVVVVEGNLAAAHYTLPITWTDKAGAHSEIGRYTQVLKRVNGKWLIWHEHFSVPYDPATGKAVLEATH